MSESANGSVAGGALSPWQERVEGEIHDFRKQFSQYSTDLSAVVTSMRNIDRKVEELSEDVKRQTQQSQPDIKLWVAIAVAVGSLLLHFNNVGLRPMEIAIANGAERSLERHNQQEKSIVNLDTVLQREMRLLDARTDEKLFAANARLDKLENIREFVQDVQTEMAGINATQDTHIANMQRTIDILIANTRDLNAAIQGNTATISTNTGRINGISKEVDAIDSKGSRKWINEQR